MLPPERPRKEAPLRELGHILVRLGPTFGVLFMVLVVASGIALVFVSTWRLAHRG